MTALHRLRTAPHEKAAIAAYCECMREYRQNIREAWLVQEINRVVRRINRIRAMLVFAGDEGWSSAYLNRQLTKERRELSSLRDELGRVE